MSDLVTRFIAAVGASAATAHGPVTAKGAAELIAGILTSIDHPGPKAGAVAISDGDPGLSDLDLVSVLRTRGIDVLLPNAPAWHTELPGAVAGVTGAVAGVVATGSVGVACGPGAPRATSVVPPVHVCIVRVDDIVETLGDALVRVQAAGLPSNLVWVSGPSRTGDLEMTITMGVHGPKRVDVVLVDERV